MIELTLPDMSCGHCVRSITEAAQRLDPQCKVEVDLPQHKARFETRTPEPELRKALAEQGYPAQT